MRPQPLRIWSNAPQASAMSSLKTWRGASLHMLTNSSTFSANSRSGVHTFEGINFTACGGRGPSLALSGNLLCIPGAIALGRPPSGGWRNLRSGGQ